MRMKLLSTLCMTAVAGSYAVSATACENPPMVTVPDGNTATTQQLLEAQQNVRTYMSAMQEYLACLNQELVATGDDALAEFKQLMVMRYDAAASEIESVVALFNAQVQAYRAANPEPTGPAGVQPGGPAGISPSGAPGVPPTAN